MLKEKISLTSKNGPGNDRRMALRAELDTLRGQQSSSKSSRGKLLEQLKIIQDGIQKKVVFFLSFLGSYQIETFVRRSKTYRPRKPRHRIKPLRMWTLRSSASSSFQSI